MIGLGHHARELAPDVGQGREPLDVGAPRIEPALPDRRLADVVEDEADLRTAPDQLDHVVELVVIDAEIEAQPETRQQLEPVDEGRPQAEGVIGLALQEPADALDQGQRRQLLEIRLDRVAVLERRRRDHAHDARVGGGQPRDQARLLLVLARIGAGLDPDDPVDLDRALRLIELRQQVGRIELRALHPAVADAAGIVEMHVSVDDRDVSHRLTLCRRGTHWL